jgi:hypothetical protein
VIFYGVLRISGISGLFKQRTKSTKHVVNMNFVDVPAGEKPTSDPSDRHILEV